LKSLSIGNEQGIARPFQLNLNWLLFISIHIPLALIMDASSIVATLHALATMGVGVWIALSTHEPRKVAWVAAYICGADVLWRMTNAQVFWEFGKYAIILVLGIYLLRVRRWRSAGLPILFFVMFLISVPLTIASLDAGAAREEISFNLSGPLCLAVCALFFYQIKLSAEDREQTVWYLATPVIGIAAVCFWGIMTADQLSFTSESNFATSGGFGPNQVSAILGLGALLLLLLALQPQKRRGRLVKLLGALTLLTLSTLTFSRGGLYNIAAALLVSSLFFLKNRRMRYSFTMLLGAIILFGGLVVLPQLNSFTDGWFAIRFSDTDPTNRLNILQAEIDIWMNNPVFGVGPGLAKYFSSFIFGMRIAAHTEYTRILAEHGIPGIISIILLLLMGIKALKRAPTDLDRAWVAALLVWPMIEMTHAAMRIASIGFIFGFALVNWNPKIDNNSIQEPREPFINR